MAGGAILQDWRLPLARRPAFWFNEPMNALWLGMLALSLACGTVRAERSVRAGSDQQQPQSADQPAPAVDSNPGPSQEPAPSGGPMSLDDARMNFGTVVDSFVAQNSPQGYW